MEWVPQCYGTGRRRELALGAFCRLRTRRRLRRRTATAPRPRYDQATDEWVLNGTKAWITNGGIADIHVVVAVVVAPELGSKGHASASSSRPAPPASRMGQKYKKHGIRASHTAEVVLDDVRVPGHVVCSAGRRSSTSALARVQRRREARQRAGRHADLRGHPAGGRRPGTRHVARAASEYATEYAKERHAFGRKPIIMNQANRLHARRHGHRGRGRPAALIWKAAWLGKQQVRSRTPKARWPSSRPPAVSHLGTTERAIQVLGGYGYTREYPVERWHRDDAKIHDIFEGTEQIQQLVISRAISGLRIE